MSGMNRRKFLEDSVIASGVAIAAARLSTPAGAVESPGRARPSGPNDVVRVGVIGVHPGARGMAHVGGYLELPDARVAAVCDVDINSANRTADEIAKKAGARPKAYQDLRRMFEDREIDAVSMALPIHWHTLASIWAMQAGKDVYVEKPVSHNLFESEKIVEAARKYRKICQCGTQSRSSQAVRDAIGFIHAGRIGKVALSRGLCYKPRGSIGLLEDSPVPDGVAYDIWLGPAPKRPFNKNRFIYNWHWHWDYGSGDLGNQGIHQMDIARWALNRNTLPIRAFGIGGRFGYVDQGETPNTIISTLDYGDSDLIFEVRGLKTDPLMTVKIGNLVYGEDGIVAFSSNYGEAVVLDRDGNPARKFGGGGNHFRNFIDAVKSRDSSELNAPIEEGALSSALCHLGNVSYRLGQMVSFDEAKRGVAGDAEASSTFDRFTKHLEENGVVPNDALCQMGRSLAVDPKTRRFVGDPEANELLTRHYRAPYVVPKRV